LQPIRAASLGETTLNNPAPIKNNSGPLTAEQEAIRQRNREAALARRAAVLAAQPGGSAAAAAVPAVSSNSSFGSTTTAAVRPVVSAANSTASRSPVAPTPTVHHVFRSNIECVIAVHSAERFKVTFKPYHECITAALRIVPSRYYEMSLKANTFLYSDLFTVYKVLSEVQEANVSVVKLPDSVVRILTKQDSGGREKSHLNPSGDLSSGIDPGLLQTLFPYQKKGVIFGISKAGRVLIADEMGLGKSIQALAIARYYRADFPLAIVCPASVKSAWKGQIERFCPAIKDNLYMPEKEKEPLPGVSTSNTVIIMSYDFLSRRMDDLSKAGYGVWIFDESHYLKDFKAKRTKAAQAVTKRCNRVILLSGTPALSRPSELYSQIKLIDPHLFSNQKEFFIRYCDGQETRFGFQAKGATNSEELSAILQRRLMIRRLKSEVLKDLPAKIREIIYLSSDEISSRMEKCRLTSARAFDAGGSVNLNDESLLEYYTHTGTAKARPVCEHIINNYFREDSEDTRKILVFGHHQIVLDTIEHTLSQRNITSIRIDGSTPTHKRGGLCTSFQEDSSVRVAVLSITAAGQGITLTAASVVIFAEIYWLPGCMQQAEDRAHRVGQKDSVLVQYMLAKNTADDVIWPLVKSKNDILEQVNLNSERLGDAERKEIDADNAEWDIDGIDTLEPKNTKRMKM
ncbi:hypothetical protein PFISCL1PPCAC_11031, partial [Pristionchus fissidentatus]